MGDFRDEQNRRRRGSRFQSEARDRLARPGGLGNIDISLRKAEADATIYTKVNSILIEAANEGKGEKAIDERMGGQPKPDPTMQP